MSDEAWETTDAKMIVPGHPWETKMYQMVWALIFDLIHHRGQLATYIRPMGGSVPSIYGPSADSRE